MGQPQRHHAGEENRWKHAGQPGQGRKSEAGEAHSHTDGRGRHHAPGHQDQGGDTVGPLGRGLRTPIEHHGGDEQEHQAGRRQLLEAEVGREFVNRHQEHHAEQAPKGQGADGGQHQQVGCAREPARNDDPRSQEQGVEQHAQRHHRHRHHEHVFTTGHIHANPGRHDGRRHGAEQTANQTAPLLDGHGHRCCDDAGKKRREQDGRPFHAYASSAANAASRRSRSPPVQSSTGSPFT